jgi:hypothetical protein
MQLLNGSPPRIIVLLTDDEREQLVDGMHARMLHLIDVPQWTAGEHFATVVSGVDRVTISSPPSNK